MTIRRAPRAPERFTRVDNVTIADERLSFKALGVLVYVLSKPDHWRTNRAHLATTHTDGEASVGTALRELREAGYITDEVERDSAGRITGKAMIVHECPVAASLPTEEPSGGEPMRAETPHMGSDPLVTTEGSNNGGKQHPPSPPAPMGKQAELLAEDPPPAKAKRARKATSAEPSVPDVDVPEATEEQKRVAREVTANVWERRDPKPAAPFIALAKIAERFLALGYERQEVGRAMFDAPTITTRSVELNLGKMRGKGTSSRPSTANERRGGLITDRAQESEPWTPGQTLDPGGPT